MVAAGDRDRAGAAVGYILAAAAVAIALGYVPILASPFVEPKLAVLVIAGALAAGGYASAVVAGSPRPRWNRSIAGASAAFGLVLLAATATAARQGTVGVPYFVPEIVRLGSMFAIAIGAALTANAGVGARRRLCEAIHAGAGLVALLGLCQHLRLLPLPLPTISVPGSTFGNRNIAAEAVAMAIPFGLGLVPFGKPAAGTTPPGRSPPLALITLFLVLEIAYLAVARARGAWLGGALGIAVFFALRRPPLSRPAVAAALAVGALAAVAAALPGRWTAHDSLDVKRFEPATRVVHDAVDPTSPVARTRLALWRRTLAIYRSHPLAGIGLGNFPVLFPLYAEPDATTDGVLSPGAVPRRAHNDLLERLAETGPFGLAALLALYAALGAAAIRGAGRARRDGRPNDAGGPAACAGSLAAFVGCGLTGFPFAMPATVFLFGVALGLLAVEAAPAPAPPPELRRRAGPLVRAAIAVGFGACAVGWSIHRLETSYWLGRADTALRAGSTPGAGEAAERALPLLARAAATAPRDFQVSLRASDAAGRAGHPTEAIDDALAALQIEPFSANAWEALGRARLDAGDAPGAVAAADRALVILHDYPGALFTRAQAAVRLGDEARASDARARLSALAATNGDARNLLETLGPHPGDQPRTP
jgi:O-antigen ligase